MRGCEDPTSLHSPVFIFPVPQLHIDRECQKKVYCDLDYRTLTHGGISMKLEWMGQHRAAVEALIRCGNSYAQGLNLRGLMTDKVDISAAELQVMEYILENEERRENMSQVAARLDISQSSFSKLVSELVRLGLLEKFRTANNRKNVIIQPTDFAREVYRQYAVGAQRAWQPIFDELDRMGPEGEAAFIRLLDAFSSSMHTAREALLQKEAEEIELIPLE